MTLDDRIEAVTRAYVEFRFGGTRDWDIMDEAAKRGFLRTVRPWLEKGFPEMFEAKK